MATSVQERAEPMFGGPAPYADVQRQMMTLADVTSELTSEASIEFTNAKRDGLGHDAVVLAQKRLTDALEQAALAAQALESVMAARAAHLQGTSEFLNEKPATGTPFFETAGKKIGAARNFFLSALDKVSISPFLDKVLTKMEAADMAITVGVVKTDMAISRGKNSFLATMRKTAETLGQMITTVQETPGRLINAAKAKGENLRDITAIYVESKKMDLLDFGRDVKSDVTLMATTTRDAALHVGGVVRDGATAAVNKTVAAGVATRDGVVAAGNATKEAVVRTAMVGEAIAQTGTDVGVAAAKAAVDTGLMIGQQVIGGLKTRFSENLAQALAKREAKAEQTPTTSRSGPAL